MSTDLIDLTDSPPQGWQHNMSTVGDFLSALDTDTTVLTTDMNRLGVVAEEGVIEVMGSDVVFELDDKTLSRIAKLLKVPSTYLKKCPPELINQNLDYWLRQSDGEVTLEYGESTISGMSNLISVSAGSQNVIPIGRMIRAVLDPFDANDTVSDFVDDDDQMLLSVTSNRFKVEVPGDGSSARPAVGDVTEGGLKLQMFRQGNTKAILQPYLLRLVCTNGMTAQDESLSRFTFRGETEDSAVDAIQDQARSMIEGIEDHLYRYAKLADQPVRGDRTQLIRHIGQESGLSLRVIDHMVSQAPSMPNDLSVYDVVNLINSAANDVSSLSVRNRLQNLAGNIYLQPSLVTNRCDNCEQLLH